MQIKNLSINFSTSGQIIHAVQDVNLNLDHAKITAIVGESGSGKSVTARAIMGLLEKNAIITSGQILHDDDFQFNSDAQKTQTVDLLTLSNKQMQKIRGKSIAMVFQDSFAYADPTMKIGYQVAESVRAHNPRLPKYEVKELVIQWLEKVGIKNARTRYNDYPHQFSGGQLQRILIAAALINSPKVLICDEPTTALDVTTQKVILELLKELSSQTDTKILFITHDIAVVANIADYVFVMQNGRVIEESRSIYNPKEAYTQQLLQIALNKQKINTLQIQEQNSQILTATGISVQYGKKHAVKNVSLSLHENEVLGIVGESGSGKTTLIKVISGILYAQKGDVNYHGVSVAKMSKSQKARFRQNVQMIFQNPNHSLDPRMKIEDIILEGVVNYNVVEKNAQTQYVKELLQKVHLDEKLATRYPHELSGGQKQRVSIARALATQCEILLCDEPTSALDVQTEFQILNLLREIQQETNLSIIFITHDINLITQYAHNIIVMHNGQIAGYGNTHEIIENPTDEYIVQLLESVPKLQVHQ
ncbi:MAG: ABC transporter ATP-binding protein [Candidatus Ancillula sp.]|jgi:peptide/nickel transport system ATP-binding protein|nr:ABC transporter ATP-binding protein [Candidatus Ancillula sp.]